MNNNLETIRIFSEDVIPVYDTDTGEKVVLGRELHERLKIKDKYTDWMQRMIGYGFSEDADYYTLRKKPKRQDGTEMPGERIEHVITLDMAKHIAMIQRTPEGMEIRQKLIDLEKNVARYPVGQPSSLQILNIMVQAVNEQAARNAETEKRVDAIESGFNNMCSIMTVSVKDDARKVCQRTLNAIATKRGGGTAYSDIWNEVYDEMKENGFDVRRRLDNRKKDAVSKGMSKTFVRKINALDIIFDSKDKKMESAFINSVRRLAAATGLKFEVENDKQPE
jgi:phage anti-repressor protein|nr:MAG TPA: AntA/AntB antirepressor [Caudoviricetes sp.]